MAIASRPIVPSRLSPGAALSHTSRTKAPRTRVGAFVALTKPRIIELLLITTVPTMVVAEQGLPGLRLTLLTLLGGALAAGGANAMNMYVDRDIDRLMPRTQGRPLVTGEVTPRQAFAFSLSLEVAAFAVLALGVNVLSAVLALSATLFYVFVYTLWLKRTSTSNIVIGGAAGAVPVLVGWSAVTGTLDWAPVVLFAVIFLWTPPHFWALAVRYADDYRKASVPMLPVVAPPEVTARKVLLYTAATVAASLVLVPVADLGLTYLVAAVATGAVFLQMALALRARPEARRAMRLFTWSISYVTLLFVAMAADVVVTHGW